MSLSQLMPYSEDEVTAVLKIFGKTPESIQKDVNAVKNWMKTQLHFPEIPGESVLVNAVEA